MPRKSRRRRATNQRTMSSWGRRWLNQRPRQPPAETICSAAAALLADEVRPASRRLAVDTSVTRRRTTRTWSRSDRRGRCSCRHPARRRDRPPAAVAAAAARTRAHVAMSTSGADAMRRRRKAAATNEVATTEMSRIDITRSRITEAAAVRSHRPNSKPQLRRAFTSIASTARLSVSLRQQPRRAVAVASAIVLPSRSAVDLFRPRRTAARTAPRAQWRTRRRKMTCCNGCRDRRARSSALGRYRRGRTIIGRTSERRPTRCRRRGCP